MNTDPKAYNLNNRVLLKRSGDKHLTIIINRKSRIIMKDGERIVKQKDMINKIKPNTTVSVETTAPVCSKTKRYLFSRNIDIVSK